MRTTRYRILRNYGAYEGMKLDDGEFDTVDAAVKSAIAEPYGVSWLIIQVVDWQAVAS